MFSRRRRRPRRGFLGHLVVWIRNLLIVAVVAAFGSRFYIEYQINKAMDRLAALAVPVGTLTHEGAFARFDGEVGVRKLSLEPSAGIEMPSLRIDEAVLHTPGYLYVLGMRGDQVLPLSMGLSLTGLRQRATDGGGGVSFSGMPFEALGCGDVSEFQALDIRNMGLPELRADLSGRYSIIPPDRMDLTLIQDTGGVAVISLSLDLLIPNLSAANRRDATPDIRLSALNLTLDATEFNHRRNQYCADRAGTGVDEFLDVHVREVIMALRSKRLLAGPTVMEQYRMFAAGDGPWKFLSRPGRPLPLTDLATSDAVSLVERLNLNSALQTNLASAVVLSRIGSAEAARILPPPQAETDDGEVQSPLPPLPGASSETGMVKQTRWKPVDLDQASASVGRVVRIRTRFGKEYSGRLSEVADGQLRVETRFPGGAATVPIPVEHVTELRVLER